jgi:uncharacterized membrane protein YdjX (TVP38/TMEM64 family)
MTAKPGAAQSGRRIERLALAAGLMLLAGALAALAWRLADETGTDITALTPGDAERFLRSWGAWSALGAVLLMVLHAFVPLPAEIIAMANGMMFGAWLGIALTWIGAMLGAFLSFALARRLGRPFVARLVAETRFREIEQLGVNPRALLVARLLPVVSFNLVNYAAGLLGVGWWTFAWTTALGILPLTILTVLLGGRLLAVPLWAWALAALVLVVLWFAWRRWRERLL